MLSKTVAFYRLASLVYLQLRYVLRTKSELEFLNSLWGLGTE
jgi:hypothetical protein